MSYTLSPLDYPYEALEPYIDAKTMQLHHDMHHLAYINNLNTALKDKPDLFESDINNLLKKWTVLEPILPESIKKAVRNQGGGISNHNFYWDIISPIKNKDTSVEVLQKRIVSKYGSLENFQNLFEVAGLSQFGSGWVWLVFSKKEQDLSIITTSNQDTPLMNQDIPIIGNDVWEHAYYLKYQNRRGEYLKAFWKILNWGQAELNYISSQK